MEQIIWIVGPLDPFGEDVECFEDEGEAKTRAIDLAEENENDYIVYKGTPVWLVEPPQEIPGTITKIKKK